MTVTLQDNALVTEAEATLYLKLGTSAAEADLVRDLINRASDFCEGPNGCDRPLIAREYENLRLPAPCSPRLRPPATPIDIEETVSISLDGVAQTVWLSEADGDPSLKDVVIGADDPGSPSFFWRDLGWRSYAYGNPFPILLSYTGGFLTLPGQLKDAAFLVIESLYRSQEKKSSDNVQAFGPGPVTPSVTYRVELIPMRAKYILESYRVPNL